jgi:hypothetical protein
MNPKSIPEKLVILFGAAAQLVVFVVSLCHSKDCMSTGGGGGGRVSKTISKGGLSSTSIESGCALVTSAQIREMRTSEKTLYQFSMNQMYGNLSLLTS